MTILIIRTGNFYSVLFPPAQSFSLVLPTRYALNLQSALTEGDRRHLPVAPCPSKQLTVALGIAKWQTVVINAMHNIGHGKFVLLVSRFFFSIILLVVAAIFVAVYTDGQVRYIVRFHF